MFKTILVPLDGSVFAEHALPLAVSAAKQSGATLRLLRVVSPLADYLFMPPLKSDPLDAQLRTFHRSEARTYLQSVVQRFKNPGPTFCDVIEEEEGISESICADIVKNKVDLIVMSSHGRGLASRLWYGSIADELVRTAPVPVLLARPPEQEAAEEAQIPAPTLKRFLVALDGNTDAERIVESALAIGKIADADFTLLRVVQPTFPHLISQRVAGADAAESSEPGNIDAENGRKAEDYLRCVAAFLRAKGATVQTRVHFAEEPAEAILREAKTVGADMIVLETHGRGISRLFVGSVADQVVRGSSIPILLRRQSH